MKRFSHGGWAIGALVVAACVAAPDVLVGLGAHRGDETPQAPAAPAPVLGDADFYGGLSFRNLTVFSRGGRVTAVAGVPTDQQLYYMGSTGGGVWKTTNAGAAWTNISDGFFEAGSIGAVAVAESNPNVIYVGTGSACPRGNVSPGIGMYKSSDAGKTWQHVGLRAAGSIGQIVVHPSNPDIAYVAVLGNLFGPSKERGVYRTRDGARTWELVHFVSDRTGAIDITMDMKNPDTLIAAMWTTERKPWSIDSGSTEGGLFRSTNGGTTWTKLGGGLPSNVMVGKIGVSISRASSQRVYAVIEAAGDQGGVFRSNDGGTTWTRTNTSRTLQQRAFYYTHITADPVDVDTVYSQNTGFLKSTDGGTTFSSIQTPHGDNHALWINPLNNKAMVQGNDGGANVSLTGGQAWSSQDNQPTAEIYRLTTDTRSPYWVYGSQQDNSSIAVPSVGTDEPYAVGGGESGYIAVDPRDYNVIYAGNYGGSISRTDRKFGVSTDVKVYADMETGQRAADMKYRFQWNSPIRLSPNNPDIVYTTSQVVHRSSNGGIDWEVISPDLTRNDKRRQGYSGGEGITRDSTGVEVYSTIFAFEESPRTPGLLWAGSDDGLVHLSRDNGKTWKNVTPPGLPEGCVNVIDISAHAPGRAHIAVYRYRQNDFTPYIYQTNDYGATWKRIADGTNGIPKDQFVRVVREDPARRGLLYAGTEFGLFVSYNDGASWRSMQGNLPHTPVTDIAIYRDDLILTTQGRGFWIVDNMSVIRGMAPAVAPGQATTTPSTDARLFKPETAYREGGQVPTFYYWFKQTPTAPVTVAVSDPSGKEIFTTTSQPGTASPAVPAAGGGRGGRGGGRGAPPPPAEGGDAPAAPARGTAPAGRAGAPPAADPAAPAAAPQRGGGGGGRGRGGFGAGAPAGPAAGAVAGLNRAIWTNMRMAPLYTVPQGIVMWGGGGGQGPKYAPGTYTVTVSSGSWKESQTFRLATNPLMLPVMTDAQGAEQLRLGLEIGNQIKALYDTLARIRDVKKQAATAVEKPDAPASAKTAAKALTDKLTSVEGEMTQLQGEGGQDALNFPGRLDNQLISLYSAITGPERRLGTPALERYKDLKPEADKVMARAKAALQTDVATFNTAATAAGVATIK